MRLFLLLLLLVVSCSHQIPTYQYFKQFNNRTLKQGMYFNHNSLDSYYQIKDYTDDEYIYVYTYKRLYYGGDARCIWGFVTDKNDIEQQAKDWVVLDGIKFCKRGSWAINFRN